MNIRANEPLSRHNTLRVGGPARFFVEANTEGEIKEALAFAREKKLNLFVLGGGSNILVNDQGFQGFVLKISTRGIQFLSNKEKGDFVHLVAEAGEEWDSVVALAVEQGLYGLENMSLIPGTVGGAVVGNIGAYGAEVKDALAWAEAIDGRTGASRKFESSQCDFRYRHSFFKTPEGRNFIVTRAAFALQKNGSVNLRYKEVQEYFGLVGTRSAASLISSPGTGAARSRSQLKDVRHAIIAIRQRKLPALDKIGTAGSFFKNPIIRVNEYQTLVRRYPGLPSHPDAPGMVKVPLGWVLDKICRLKGARKGLVGTHPDQALVIVNEGGTAAEIESFANHIAASVKDFTGLTIEWEVEKL